MSTARNAWGLGLSTIAADGTVLDAWYPELGIGTLDPSTSMNGSWRTLTGEDERREVSVELVQIGIDLDAPATSTADAYLRLQLLSRLLVRPNEQNLDGIFGHLPTVAWTSAGPMLPEAADRLQPALRRAGIQVQGLDKFPRLTDYVQPAGVRIADTSRVRLGAHLSPGTTVMHEGFVNFNAGSLGASMIEGRISQGVVVGDGSDIGGGASIMGTLSGAVSIASPSASARCSAPTQASGSRWVMTASWRPGCMSPPAPRSSWSTVSATPMARSRSSRPRCCLAATDCCSGATP